MNNLKSLFATWIREYSEYRIALRYSTTHFLHLRSFDSYCYENHPNDSELSHALIKGWFSYESATRPGCLRDAYFSMNGFLKYFKREDLLLSSDYLPKKQSAPMPYLLSDEELVSFFSALNNAHWTDRLSRYTMGCLIRLLYSTGIRPTEARLLKLADVDLIYGTIEIKHAKRHIDRTITVSDETKEMLSRYNFQRSLFVANSEYFFSRSDGSAISQNYLWNTVTRCWKTANANVKDIPTITPYTFRHQFASAILMKWLEEGKDLYAMMPYLKAHMGHLHYSSTVYYIHLLPTRLLDSANIDWRDLDRIGKDVATWEN